jgi:uncharacterized protein
MGVITDEVKRVVEEQQLGFWATVCPDGSPNLSPKGTTHVWDGDHLFFADICSPQTVANIRAGSRVEVNVVDPFLRKGYRFKGSGAVHEPPSALFDEAVARLTDGGTRLAGRATAIVLMKVESVAPLVSPIYDDGTTTEEDVLASYRTRYARLHDRLGHR